ncbi:MAG: YgiQ family radical SAM protein, partial [Spirochaetales bacterium]|nr:YgiQ family radical SAM protein [Spirochaetales bacterium]
MGKADSLDYLPVSRQDLERRGWRELDFVLISGDAYIDHPSFGAALIARLLESRGYRTGIIPQPDWRNV